MKTYDFTEIDFRIEQLAHIQPPLNVLTCTPDYFEVKDIKNVHMKGNVGKVEVSKANSQWNFIKNIYLQLETEGKLQSYHELPGLKLAEDMVFAANPAAAWVSNEGVKQLVLSNMVHPSRQLEVPAFKEFFLNLGYQIIALPSDLHFEGNGDLIAHPNKRLLYGGYGKRTHKAAHEHIAKSLQTPVVLLQLIDDRFYHLDTCFHPIDTDTVLVCPEAFSLESFNSIKKLFKNVIRISAQENASFFALNCNTIVNGSDKICIIHYGSTTVYNHLIEHGFQIHEVDTSEFMKSGGSVFCMKLMYY